LAEAVNLEATLEGLIIEGPVDDLREFLSGKEARGNRAKLCSLARKWHKKSDNGHFVEDGNLCTWMSDHPAHVSTRAFEALLLTLTASEFKNVKWNGGDFSRLSLELAKLLEADCLSACVESLLIENPRVYRAVRAIVSAGLCPRPKIEQYAVGLIAFKSHHQNRDEVLTALHSDLKILEDDIWLLFETEGSGEMSLAAIDKYSRPGNQWSDILYYLAKGGTLPRERLLKASLEALNRGFIQFRAGWFSRFHESLKPSEAERLSLTDDYGKLLASNIAPTVSFALSAWLAIDKTQPIQSDVVARYLPPCLTSQSKSTVISALSLIEKVCKRDKAFRKHGLRIALQALSQENTDVQGRLLKLLTEQSEIIDDEIRSLIEQQLDMVAPSLQEGFRSLTGTNEQAPGEAVEVYAIANDACESFFRGERLTIIEKAEDFVEVTLALLETPFNPASAEIVLASVALGKVEALRSIAGATDDSLLSKLTRPLLARMKKIEKQQAEAYTKDATYFFLHFLLHFLGADSIPENYRAKPQEYFKTLAGRVLEQGSFDWATRHFADRLIGILERSSKGVFTKIALPTWDSGYVSAEDFLQQAEMASSSDCFFLECEPYLSVMRLPWSDHEVVLTEIAAKGYSGQYLEKIKKILSQLIEVRQAFADKDPYERDLLVIKALVDSQDNCLASMARIPGITSHDGVVLLLSSYNYPTLLELFHDEGAKECKRLVRWFEVSDLSRLAYFLPMAFGIAPLKGRAHFLLAVGCLLSAPEIKALVSDCLVTSIEQRKLNPGLLGEKLGLLLHSEISMPKRVATILGEITRISSLHNDAVRQVLELSFARNPQDSQIGIPRELGALLEVLQACSLKARQPIKNQTTRTYLESFKPGSKAGKLAKELLALK
jgi:hypothetical protein